MPGKQTNTKERLIQSSIDLFRSKGYSGTGLKEIVSSAGAPWGSLYHFFPDGKEQLGAEVVDHAGALDNVEFQRVFASQGDPLSAIRKVFRSEARRLERSGYLDGCTVAAVASDVAGSSDTVRRACSSAFDAWQQTIQSAFAEQGISRSESRTYASFVLSCLEGATILARAHQSTRPFQDSLKMIERALRDVLNH